MAAARLVLLDEPGAGVNPTLMGRIVDRVRTMTAEGITFLLIEHDMDLVMGLCDPIVVVSAGRWLTQDSAAEGRAHPAVLQAYFGGQYTGEAR